MIIRPGDIDEWINQLTEEQLEMSYRLKLQYEGAASIIETMLTYQLEIQAIGLESIEAGLKFPYANGQLKKDGGGECFPVHTGE